MNLYHSFPRGQNKNNSAFGLKVLESILDIGLLITPEERKAPVHKDLQEKLILQRRLCFTALRPNELPKHAETFGAFSFVFDPAELRDFGVLPAFYLTTQLPDGSLLNGAGGGVLRSIVAVQDLITRLIEKRDGQDQAESDFVYRVHPAKPEEVEVKLELRELYWTLDALLNLYYPTEDLSYTILLGYYEQREWRITPNFSHNREWHYPRVEGGNRDKLLMLNQDFFGKKLETTGRPRIEDCLSFENVAGKRLLDNAAALIVPDDVIDAAQKLVAQKGFGFTVVKASEHK